MVAEIIAVGTELLLGQITNTNAQYLSQRCSELGMEVYHHVVVGDNPARIQDCLKLGLERADIILMTGGLGPTKDDLTKETVADYFGLQMVRDAASEQQIRDFFCMVNRPMAENNLKQADIPEGSTVLYNGAGTAPGCLIEQNGKMVAVMPGPPHEMKTMFENELWPILVKKSGYVLRSRIIRTFGIGESSLAQKIDSIIATQTNPTIATYVDSNGTYMRITAKAQTAEQADVMIKPMEAEVKALLSGYIYGYDQETMAGVLGSLLLEHDLKLSVAESCTGGLVASKLVEVPGISKVLMEGIVAYSNEAKVNRLGVSHDTLEQYGAVSAQTAQEMAKGLLGQNCDIAVSTTGIAGPEGGTDTKKVGLVYIGLADKERCEAYELNLFGNRLQIMNNAALNAMQHLIKFIHARKG